MLLFFMALFLCLFLNFVLVSANRNSIVKYCNYKDFILYTEAYNYSDKEEAIIFLHGLGGSHLDGSFLHTTENNYLTISIDMLNHGQSGKLKNSTWDTYIDSVKAVIKEYGIKKAHFVGHSFGGDIAMMYASKYPQDVADMVLLDGAYYNFFDVKEYNFTSSFYKVVEYDSSLDVDVNSFNNIIDMSFHNDISKAWNIDKNVLLLAANPYWATPSNGEQSIVDYISMIKHSPADFGITSEQASSLPDLTLDNLYSYMKFLKTKIDDFALVNKRFFVALTPFDHNMVNDDSAKLELIKYVLEFINNKDKKIATDNINIMLNENKCN